jgi:O-antigen/teichoic acid export membrane protein
MTGDVPDLGGPPLTAVEIQGRAVTGSIWTAINTLVFLPMAFIANAIIARNLGVTSYGRLAFLTATFALALPLTNFGFTMAFLQRGSRAEATGRRALAGDLLEKSLGFHTFVQMPLLLLVVVALTFRDGAFEISALVATVVLSCVLSGGALSLTIENRTAAGAKIAIATNTVAQVAAVTAALVTSSAPAVWAARTVVPAAALIANFAFLDATRRRRALRPRVPRFDSSFWRFALLSWMAGLLGLLVFSRSEIFLLEAFHKLAGLGWFAVAFGLSQQMTAPVDALLLPLLPAIAGLLTSWPERAQAAFERSTRISAVASGVVAAVVVPTLVFGVPLVYGANFARASWLFLPLALISMLQSVNNPVTAFVNARERGAARLKATAVALFVNVIVAVALIPQYGAWGAVVANVVGQAVAIGSLAAVEPAFRNCGVLGVLDLYRSFFTGLVSAGLAILAGVAVGRFSSAAAMVVAGGTGAATYPLFLRATRSGLTIHDRDVFVRAVPPRLEVVMSRMLRPITREVRL